MYGSRYAQVRPVAHVSTCPLPMECTSLLHICAQYVQGYKMLCWLMAMVIGGMDGGIPAILREVFRLDELMLVSDMRMQIFLCLQCGPFVLSKVRYAPLSIGQVVACLMLVGPCALALEPALVACLTNAVCFGTWSTGIF